MIVEHSNIVCGGVCFRKEHSANVCVSLSTAYHTNDGRKKMFYCKNRGSRIITSVVKPGGAVPKKHSQKKIIFKILNVSALNGQTVAML